MNETDNLSEGGTPLDKIFPSLITSEELIELAEELAYESVLYKYYITDDSIVPYAISVHRQVAHLDDVTQKLIQKHLGFDDNEFFNEEGWFHQINDLGIAQYVVYSDLQLGATNDTIDMGCEAFSLTNNKEYLLPSQLLDLGAKIVMIADIYNHTLLILRSTEFTVGRMSDNTDGFHNAIRTFSFGLPKHLAFISKEDKHKEDCIAFAFPIEFTLQQQGELYGSKTFSTSDTHTL